MLSDHPKVYAPAGDLNSKFNEWLRDELLLWQGKVANCYAVSQTGTCDTLGVTNTEGWVLALPHGLRPNFEI